MKETQKLNQIQKEETLKNVESEYVIEMRNITKVFPGIIANDNITIQLKKGEIHALLGENGAGKSTLMSVLFGIYTPEKGKIYKNGKEVKIKDPNDATRLGIGMVHQHFRLVECFSVIDNIILGAENSTAGWIKKKLAKKKVLELSKKYGLKVDINAIVSDITVGMQQRTEILKMLYRDNEILIFDEPTAVLTPQEIEELMQIMRNLKAEGKSILFISHKLNEIMEVADRCSVLRKGKYVGTVDVKDTNPQKLSELMVGREVKFVADKDEAKPTDVLFQTVNLSVKGTNKNLVNKVNINVRKGEIVCIAGIDGNGQTEFVHAITGLRKINEGHIFYNGEDYTHKNIRYKNTHGFSHIPEDRHKHGLVLDYSLEQNMVLQRYFEKAFQKYGFIKFNEVRKYSEKLIDAYDVRSGQRSKSIVRGMSGGNQQKAIIAREMDKEHELLIAVQPTRGLDVGAIEGVHKKIIAERDKGKGILLISLELEEVMNLSDRIYVMYEGEIVGELNPKKISVSELGLYMAGAKRDRVGNNPFKELRKKDVSSNVPVNKISGNEVKSKDVEEVEKPKEIIVKTDDKPKEEKPLESNKVVTKASSNESKKVSAKKNFSKVSTSKNNNKNLKKEVSKKPMKNNVTKPTPKKTSSSKKGAKKK